MESWIDIPEAHKAANHETRTGKKHEGNCDFCYYEGAESARVSAACSAGAFFECGLRIDLRNSKGRRETE